MMQKKVFLIVSLCFLLTGLYAQEKKVGIMLERMVLDSKSFSLVGGLEANVHAMHNAMKPRSKNDYSKKEKTYFGMLEQALEKSFKQQGYNSASLVFDDLSREEIDKEEKLYLKVQNEQSHLFLNSKVLLLNKKKRPKYVPDKTAGPLANIFADKLDSDLLLFVFADMYHFKKTRSVAEEIITGMQDNGTSSIALALYLVDGNTGRLVSYSAQSKYAKILGSLPNPVKLVTLSA